jgi:hypothetical protein
MHFSTTSMMRKQHIHNASKNVLYLIAYTLLLYSISLMFYSFKLYSTIILHLLYLYILLHILYIVTVEFEIFYLITVVNNPCIL